MALRPLIATTAFTLLACGASGDWQMRFTRNGQSISTGSYHLIPSINPDRVSFIQAPAYNQGYYSTVQYGNICRDPADGEFKTCSLVTTPNPPQARISQLGCLLTGYAAALSYHGLATLPNELNDYLRDYNGYNDGGGIVPQVVVRYARSRNPDLKLTFVRRDAAGESGTALAGIARDAVCRSGPTPLSVRHHTAANPTGSLRQHFATAWGRPEPETTYLLKDPNGGASNRLDSTVVPRDYRNLHYGTRELREAPPAFVFADSLTISLHSPAELLLTDPSGRRTGVDPVANATHNEIPGSSYGVDAIDPPDEPEVKGIESKMLEITPVEAGNYSLRVTGTGSGKYSLNFLFLAADDVGSAKTAVRDVPTAAGMVHTYLFTAPFTSGEPIKLGGGFDGGGQRPRDVNKFLSYATLAQSRTAVPAGTTSYPLIIAYDAATVPGSFSATLNGASISTSFHPAAGGFETVMIPLARGNNTLVLSIDGQTANRTATDTDRLVFLVP